MEVAKMKIGIGSDHGGYLVKGEIKKYLQEKYEVVDFGTDSEESTDYPKYAHLVGEAIQKGNVDFGVVICRTGIGMSIACNKMKGIRCAKVDNLEEASLTRLHNNSNVIALNANKNIEEIKESIDTFLTTPFSNEERHIRRIEMLESCGE